MKKLIFLLVVLIFVNGCVVAFKNDDEGARQEVVESVNSEENDLQEEADDDSQNEEDVQEETEENSSDIDLIKSYYEKLVEGDLQGAFDLKKAGKTTYSQFAGWYKNVLSADVSGFEELAEHKYRFEVDLSEADDRESKYTVTMLVEDGLLNTLSSVKTWDNFSAEAYTVEGNGETKLYARKDGEEMLVTRFTTESDDETEIYNLTSKEIFFERYLVYVLSGYEWHVLRVFDLDKDKEVMTYGEGFEKFGFSEYGKYFYVCGGTGMLGGGVKIYEMPSFDLYKDLRPQGAMVFACYNYDKGTNSFKYSITRGGFDYKDEEVHEYYFDTGVVK